VELDVRRRKFLAGADEGATVAKAGRQRPATLLLEQRQVGGRHRGAQALLAGAPHQHGHQMVLEVAAHRQVNPRLDAPWAQLIRRS
jgi:hypothetical protein